MPRTPDSGTAPNNSQGVEIVHPEDIGHDNPPNAKKLKLIVDRENLTTQLTRNHREMQDPGHNDNWNDGKHTYSDIASNINPHSMMADVDNIWTTSNSCSCSSSEFTVVSDLTGIDSSDKDSISTAVTDKDFMGAEESKNNMSMDDSDKSWTIMHKEDDQGMSNNRPALISSMTWRRFFGIGWVSSNAE